MLTMTTVVVTMVTHGNYGNSGVVTMLTVVVTHDANLSYGGGDHVLDEVKPTGGVCRLFVCYEVIVTELYHLSVYVNCVVV